MTLGRDYTTDDSSGEITAAEGLCPLLFLPPTVLLLHEHHRCALYISLVFPLKDGRRTCMVVTFSRLISSDLFHPCTLQIDVSTYITVIVRQRRTR